MMDYKPPRRKKAKARILSLTGYLVVLAALCVMAGGGLIVRLTIQHIVNKAHEPLPAKAQLSNEQMLPYGRETERTLQ